METNEPIPGMISMFEGLYSVVDIPRYTKYKAKLLIWCLNFEMATSSTAKLVKLPAKLP